MQRLAPEHAVCDSEAVAARLTRAGTVFVGNYSAQASGDYVTGSNHVLPTGGAAAARGGLSTADFVRVSTVQTLTAAGLRRIAPAGIALAVAEGLHAHADSLRIRTTHHRERDHDLRVREGPHAVERAAPAPEREHRWLFTEGRRCAPAPHQTRPRRSIRATTRSWPQPRSRLGVEPNQLVLTNGLDEGILAITVAALRDRDAAVPEAVVVVPAFDMYASTASGVGARVVEVPLGTDFSFPADRILAAIGPHTRLLFLTSPNNPTGLLIPRADIVRIARHAPHVRVLVDEAYADFAGTSLVGDAEVAALPNIFIGRTFAKAYGLAGLRAGAVIGDPSSLEPLRRVVPPFSINACAAAALAAGLGRRGLLSSGISARCGRRRPCSMPRSARPASASGRARQTSSWRTSATAPQPSSTGLAARGVHVRDKSRDPACPGCVRITTGVVEHTQACIDALEEVLCGAA